MSDLSPVLALPYILPAQAQKHVTHNEALRILDVLVQSAVLERSLTAPPGSPADGERYIVAPGGSGAWAGQDNNIALSGAGGWEFFAPLPGWSVHVVAENCRASYDGVGWGVPADGPLRVARLGVSATPDATNRLAVTSPATLLNHDGAGHQLKINKAAAGDTASLLYQTGFSGRAEMGTAGSDDFAIKVSPDGAAWNTGLSLAAATGKASLPAGAVVTGSITGTAITQSATDTTAGRLLKVGDGGLNSTILRDGMILGDWLSTTAPTGFYNLGNDTETPNKPGTLAGGLWGGAITVRSAANLITRFGWGTSRNATEFYLQKMDSGGWGSLQKFYTNRNAVGTVSQVSGVPDGAIVEKGSNANGSYTRFADGTQICWHTLTGSTGAASTWTFPAAFSLAPVVGGTAVATVLSVVCLDAVPTTTAATLSARDAAGRRADVMHLTATGRWF